jgi:hypothetical protein
MKFWKKLGLLAGLALTICSVPGFADAVTHVYVDDDWATATIGQEVELGKFFGTNAFASIQNGVTAVDSGGTVTVQSGTYPMTASMQISKSVVVQGDGATTVSFTNGAYDGWVLAASDITIENLYFVRNGYTSYNGLIGIPRSGGPPYMVQIARPVIRKCRFEYGRYHIIGAAEDLTVENCFFDNSYSDSIVLQTFRGTATIRGNTFDGQVRAGKKAVLLEHAAAQDEAASGTINIVGNTCIAKTNFVLFNLWGDNSRQIDLNVSDNDLASVGSGQIVFYTAFTSDPPDSFSKFRSILIDRNVVSDGARPAVYIDYNSSAAGPLASTKPVAANGQIVVRNTVIRNNNVPPQPTHTLDNVTTNIGFYSTVAETPPAASMAMFSMSNNRVVASGSRQTFTTDAPVVATASDLSTTSSVSMNPDPGSVASAKTLAITLDPSGTNRGFDGFIGAQAIGRAFFVATNMADGTYVATVSVGYTDAEASAAGIAESDLVLGTWDMEQGKWVLAVDRNTRGTKSYIGVAPPVAATLANLGKYGVDTAANVIWAVVDHSSEYIGGRSLGGVVPVGLSVLEVE